MVWSTYLPWLSTWLLCAVTVMLSNFAIYVCARVLARIYVLVMCVCVCFESFWHMGNSVENFSLFKQDGKESNLPIGLSKITSEIRE